MFLKLSSAYTILSLSLLNTYSVYASNLQEEVQRIPSYQKIPYFFKEEEDSKSPFHFSSL